MLVSISYLGYKLVYSVLVVADQGVFKFINTVEVKIHAFYHSEFSFILAKFIGYLTLLFLSKSLDSATI